MILRFIGKDSLGLKRGEYYDVKVRTRGHFIIVFWKAGTKEMCCPYTSPQRFANNWERGVK